VFKSFNADVPRSSGDYSNIGREINIEDARQGDIILFKGTKSHHPHSIGHIAIVYSNEGHELRFIHSTSGKENGVTISAMDGTYKRRFVKVIRLLKQNDIFQAQVK
jgi:murein DD-endopeptidase / murein LD-carboxypeptidase